jgi:ribose-phosphate pyrophosphokinase
MKPIIFGLGAHDAVIDAVVRKTRGENALLAVRQFPDGEYYLRTERPVLGRPVVVVADLAPHAEKLLPALFAADLLRDLGAASVGLVCPYLPYMRQDKRFAEGEGVTSRYFARLISSHYDWLVTVDPHLHRYRSLWDVYAVPSRVVHAGAAVARWIADHVAEPVLVGPDEESKQWVADTAAHAGLPFILLRKTRIGDRDVAVALAEGDIAAWNGHTPVIVDDIISTGHTLMETVKLIREAGLAAPVCVAVHAVFAGDAFRELIAAGAQRVVTCNTIPHHSNHVDLSEAIADAAAHMLAERTAAP